MSTIRVRGRNGQVFNEAFPGPWLIDEAALQIQLDNGNLTLVDEEKSDEVAKPSQPDPKDAWVEYAVSQGMSRDEAEGQTKRELMERYK